MSAFEEWKTQYQHPEMLDIEFTWNAALEHAAKICDGIQDNVTLTSVASDCADAIRKEIK